MSRRARAASAAALFLIGAAFAQDIAPTWAGFHDWTYATALVLAASVPLGYMNFVRKGGDGPFGARWAIALIGALLAGIAGLASGLLGPDTVAFARAPGTVLPLPDLGVAAFFPNADAQGVARGDLAPLLRRRDGRSITLPSGTRRFFGSYALESRPLHAAYVQARNGRGERLTITQPAGTTFLSPTLLFPSSVPIGGRMLPSDTFAVPAAHRRVQAMYFSSEAVHGTHAGRGIGNRPAVLFAVEDDTGRMTPNGIALSALGGEAFAGGLVLRATAGSYPELIVSAVPSPAVLWLGAGWTLAGALLAFGAAREGAARS